MSQAVFPVLASLGWSVKKTPQWSTKVQTAVSGKEQRTAFWSYPLWTFTLTYELLRTSPGIAEYQTLLDFFLARQGSFDTFLYSDPSDSTVAAQAFGTGTGSLTAFQLVRQILSGGFSEPVQNVNGTPAVYVNGAQSLAISPPAAPTLGDVAGGAFSARTYYVKVTYVGPTGETIASAESSRAVAVNRLLTITSPAAVTGAVAYHVYVWTTTGAEVKQTGSSPIAIGTTWTLPTSGLISGAAVPVSNTTGWTLGSTGIVTFISAPANGAALTWTGAFYYRCRFVDDLAEFEEFASNLWKLGELKFMTVKT